MLPTRLILINQQVFKGVFKFEVIAISSELRLQYELYQFNGQLTNSIIQSFTENSSNMQFFKALPIVKLFSHNISIFDSEKTYLYLQSILSQPQTQQILKFQLPPNLIMYLEYNQLFSINNFILQFINSYEIIKLNLTIFQKKQDIEQMQQIIPQPVQPETEVIVQNTIEIEDPSYMDGDNSECVILLNDVLKLSPNKLTTYYISKFINNNIINGKYEKINIKRTPEAITLEFSPLIEFYLIEFTEEYYKTILNILNSFTYSNDEYISSLKSLVSQIVYIITNYDEVEIKKVFLPLKIIEFLLYIYSIKLSPINYLSYLQINKTYEEKLHLTMLGIVNYSISYILKNYTDVSKLKYHNIVLNHLPSTVYEEEEFEFDKVRNILQKELYLIDIDRDHFISRVFNQCLNEKEGTKKAKLILNSPNTLDITKFIDSETTASSWLNYKTIIPEQKQFENNKIITTEYMQVLQLMNIPKVSIQAFIKTVHPIIARYTDTIVNIIIKELSMYNLNSTISTLYLLNTHIRPYLNEDSTVDTELFILYKIVIPYLYDEQNITTFIDYFH